MSIKNNRLVSLGSCILLSLFVVSGTLSAQLSLFAERPDIAVPESRLDSLEQLTDGGYNFIIATDMNRYGHFGQREVAYRMGDVAEAVGAEFIVATGDVFHYLGVQSVQDPIFQNCFEEMYTHPELQLPWYVIAGNHEYKGNTQALIDYSDVSRRWTMPSLYYSKSIEDDGLTADLFFIDTPPLIDKYRKESEEYPDASKHSREDQLKWLEEALSSSKARHKIVFGHHPIYAETTKNPSEREDMQKYVDPLLRAYGVDYYFSGHIHNFQAIRKHGSGVGYFTISSISKTRTPKAIDGTLFCSSSPGFAVVSLTERAITVYFLDGEARVIYQETQPAR